MNSYFQDIEDFHEKFDVSVEGYPLSQELLSFRLKFLDEELNEIKEATSPEDFLDGIVDLVYVALGTAQLCGFDFDKAWFKVHQANMSKVKATSAEESKRGYGGDIVKPPGWVSPDLSDCLKLYRGK